MPTQQRGKTKALDRLTVFMTPSESLRAVQQQCVQMQQSFIAMSHQFQQMCDWFANLQKSAQPVPELGMITGLEARPLTTKVTPTAKRAPTARRAAVAAKVPTAKAKTPGAPAAKAQPTGMAAAKVQTPRIPPTKAQPTKTTPTKAQPQVGAARPTPTAATTEGRPGQRPGEQRQPTPTTARKKAA